MRRGAAIVLMAGLAAAGAGCGPDLQGPRSEVRTGRITLSRAMHRAFLRQYAAAYRMQTGRANRDIVRYANVQCRTRGRQPNDDAVPWRWGCRVRWFLQDGSGAGIAPYDVDVGARGCFEARTRRFPARIPERVLGRDAPNPLASFRSCP